MLDRRRNLPPEDEERQIRQHAGGEASMSSIPSGATHPTTGGGIEIDRLGGVDERGLEAADRCVSDVSCVADRSNERTNRSKVLGR
jgi:hypothetical protein